MSPAEACQARDEDNGFLVTAGKAGKKKRYFVVIGGDTKEIKKNVYIPIGLCVAVSISKAGQELGEYTKM